MAPNPVCAILLRARWVTAHIGASGHHIISQGEADRIPIRLYPREAADDRDALGLNVYQWKKLESIRKLEKTG